MRSEDGAAILRVELAADVPFERRNLHDLDETSIRVCSRSYHASLFELLKELGVVLVAMAVALANIGLAVYLVGTAAGLDGTIVCTKTHRASLIGDIFLILHDVDDRVWSSMIHLGAVGLLPTEDVAGELDDGHLHTEADAEERNIVLTSVTSGDDLALDAAIAEARGDDDALKTLELGVYIVICEALGMDKLELCLTAVVGSRMVDGLDYGLVGIGELDVLADETDTHWFHLLCSLHLVEESDPVGHVALVVARELELSHGDLVEMLLLHENGHLVDGVDVDTLDYSVGIDIAEKGDLLTDRLVDILLGTEDENVGLDAFLLKGLDGVLGWLGLKLLACTEIRDESKVDEHCAVTEFPLELANSLDEGKALDVADGTTNLSDYDIVLMVRAHEHDAALYLVGDVRDDLDSLAKIVATTLLLDDTLINTPGSDVVVLAGSDIEETLVVAKVEVCLGAVFGHVALAMLVRVERAGINVKVRVKFLDGDVVATALEKLGQ